ncbi:MAG: hypothetical protein ABIU86_12700 [Gemmatimonadaceae bacterium]
MDKVTLVVAPAKVLPFASWIVTTTAGSIALAAITLEGNALNASLVAVAGVVLSEHAIANNAAGRKRSGEERDAGVREARTGTTLVLGWR